MKRKPTPNGDKMNISKLNKADVLAALYNNSRPQGLGYIHFTPEAMTSEEAQGHLDKNEHRYFDYLKGRVLKVDLSGDELYTDLYDRDNGQGAAEDALAGLVQV